MKRANPSSFARRGDIGPMFWIIIGIIVLIAIIVVVMSAKSSMSSILGSLFGN